VKVYSEEEYYLWDDLDNKVDEDRLSFLTGYIRPYDEDGYSPPKYFVMDGQAEEIAIEHLKDSGLDKEYEIDEYHIDMGSVSLKTVHVLDEVTSEITGREFKRSKMTLMTVPIKFLKDYDEEKGDEEDEEDEDPGEPAFGKSREMNQISIDKFISKS